MLSKIKDFYYQISKRLKILIAFFLTILIASFVIAFLMVDTQKVPEDFMKARQEASNIAQEIVSLSNQSTQKIDEISQLDQEGKYADALSIVSQELANNVSAKEKAMQLSNQLKVMTENINQISPSSDGQIALDAITSETSLIYSLITYNDYLTQLLGILREKFLGKNKGDGIPDLINKINEESRAINDLNQKFNDLMDEFDGN